MKQRLKLIESSVATPGHALPRAASRQDRPPTSLETLGSASAATDAHAQATGAPQFYKSQAAGIGTQSHFEISGSLLFLQPGAGPGDLEYATLVTPFPLATPNWENQSLAPGYSPSFGFGLRYIPTDAVDIRLNWTHLNSDTSASVAGTPLQMIGPSYEVGPDAFVYKKAQGTVNFGYDSVNFDAGHTFCTGCPFQLRVFGGAEFARIKQTLSAAFQSPDGLTTAGNTTESEFTGAGPRLGIKGQYAVGNLQFFGETAAAGLIGISQSRINFTATSPAALGLGVPQPNNQALTSPNATQVIPSLDAKLGTAYTFPPSNYGRFKIEAGYQAAIYMNAINQYALTEVAVSPVASSVGVFLATAQHLQSNFTTQGPYMTANWLF